MIEYRDVAIQLAREAGHLQIERLEYGRTIERKESIQLVTEVDKACEKLIVERIRKLYPDHDILAEEGSGITRNADVIWIVDPLDGTTNYAHRFPFFGVSIGVLRKGVVIAGAIFDPIRGEMFAAARGEGATLNGAPMGVSRTTALEDALLATGFAYVDRSGPRVENVAHFESFVRRAVAVRRPGAVTIDLAYVACGRLDGFWEKNLKPWDMAAGALIIVESGGKVTSFDGSPYDLYGKEIVASNGRIHSEMIEVLHG